nr:carbonic anhydrase-related protein 10-like [Cherax quadricarinatus]
MTTTAEVMTCMVLIFVSLVTQSSSSDMGVSLGWNWEMWWTYDGISGPEFWGVINPAWAMCSEGRRQSPINLDPRTLLHDPNLTPISLDKTQVSVSNPTRAHSPTPGAHKLKPFRLFEIKLWLCISSFQVIPNINIHRCCCPPQLQIYGYNAQLYRNFSRAASQVYGVVAVAVLIQLGDRTSPALSTMLEALPTVKYGGSSSAVHQLSVRELLPTTEQYLTYDGSLTVPGCYETVTWILPNKPLYIAFSQMRGLRRLKQGSSDFRRNAPVANNFRPLQSAHHRTVRTNIDFSDTQGKKCSVSEPKFHYRANDWLHS